MEQFSPPLVKPEQLSISSSDSFSNATRLICASVYLNNGIRSKLYSFFSNPHNPIVNSIAINTEEILTNVLNSFQREKINNLKLFFPAVGLFAVIIYIFFVVFNNEYYQGDPTFSYLTAIFFYIVCTAIICRNEWGEKRFVRENFSSNSPRFSIELSAADAKFISSMKERMCQNVIYFQGYSPFVGSGYDQGGWSFVVDIDKGKQNFGKSEATIPFEDSELYDFIDNGLNNLKIPNLQVEDKIFINGKSIRNNQDILPKILEHPICEIPHEYFLYALKHIKHSLRHYKVLKLVDWDGDFALSGFFRVQKDERSLFVECNYFVLPPIGSEYREVDSLKNSFSLKTVVAEFLGYLITTPFFAIGSIFKTVEDLREPFKRAKYLKELKKQIKESPDYDYGAYTSLRELVSQSHYTQRFQISDKERYVKILDKKLFNLLSEFLDIKNIDTSEFKERETSILNQGVIVTGGTFTGKNVAVGEKAAIEKQGKTNLKGSVKI